MNMRSTSAPTAQTVPIVFVVEDDVSVRESLELLSRCASWQAETFASARAIWGVGPVLVFATVFGLSMDYEVFLLTRVKKAFDGTRRNDYAVSLSTTTDDRRIGDRSPTPSRKVAPTPMETLIPRAQGLGGDTRIG